jgi:hypothetical protein
VTYEAKRKVYFDHYQRLNAAENKAADIKRLNVTKLLKRLGYKKNKDRFRTVTRIKTMDPALSRMVMSFETISAQVAEWTRDAMWADDACAIELFFSNISMTSEAVAIFFELLERNKSLRKFCLLSIHGEDGKPTMLPKQLRGSLFQSLSANTTLHTLRLSNNSFGDEGAEAVRDALWNNKTITCIDLFGNGITDRGALAIAEMMIDQCSSECMPVKDSVRAFGRASSSIDPAMFGAEKVCTTLDDSMYCTR